MLVLVFALIAVLAVVAYVLIFAGRAQAFNGPTAVVERQKLALTIVERGTLEAENNNDIVCRVKTIANRGISIKELVDNGALVKKGDVLIQLDDATLKDQQQDQLNKVSEAEAAAISAEQDLTITKSENFSSIETAKTERILAGLNLKKHIGEEAGKQIIALETSAQVLDYLKKAFLKEAPDQDGAESSEYLQTLKEIKGRLEIAKSEREQWEDKASYSQRMVIKGYLSRSQAASDQARLDSARITLRKIEGELDILNKFDLEKKVTELWSKVKEADRALDREKTKAESKEVQAKSKRDSKKSLFKQEKEKYDDIGDEIKKCKILAPEDGLVVYSLSEQAMRGFGQQQAIVAQGELVKEGQKLMRIPNMEKMVVTVKVHEAMISQVKRKLPAKVRIEVQQGRTYDGHVEKVDAVPSAGDWMSTDVKLYPTIVKIDEIVTELKPGMSAEVTIFADQTPEEVLTIPIQAVLGSVASGAERKCFVLDETTGQPRLTDIVVGMSNDKVVEVRSGLKEKQKVVLNPRQHNLLAEGSDLRSATPPKQRGANGDSPAPKQGGAPGGDKGGKGGFPGSGDKGVPGAGGDKKGGFGKLDPELMNKLKGVMKDGKFDPEAFQKLDPETRNKLMEMFKKGQGGGGGGGFPGGGGLAPGQDNPALSAPGGGPGLEPADDKKTRKNL